MADAAAVTQPAGTVLGRVLRREGIDGQEVCELRLGSSANTIVAETADLVIRIGWCAPVHPEREAAIWRAAARVGLPVPELLAHGAIDGHGYMVYPRLRGWTQPGSAQVLHEAGVMLAALHGSAALDPFPVRLHARPRRMKRFELARSFLGEQGGRIPRQAVSCLGRAQQDWASVFDTPTHGDFRGANLVARAGRIAGVLDWSDARRASREADLGSIDRPAFLAILDGYRGVAPGLRGAELAGYFAARYAALAATRVVSAEAAIEAIGWCLAALDERGITVGQGERDD